MTAGPLVVGYGNPLRSDDGLGWHAAETLGSDPRLDGVLVLQRHQLTPELALDISAATVVVLVDATSAAPAGTVTVNKVDHCAGAQRPGPTTSTRPPSSRWPPSCTDARPRSTWSAAALPRWTPAPSSRLRSRPRCLPSSMPSPR
ncbi:MAG: hydrogenase maturation protease [Actinomycetota bacterium]